MRGIEGQNVRLRTFDQLQCLDAHRIRAQTREFGRIHAITAGRLIRKHRDRQQQQDQRDPFDSLNPLARRPRFQPNAESAAAPLR